jgi:predicted MPP superfamily phosphohydrolase
MALILILFLLILIDIYVYQGILSLSSDLDGFWKWGWRGSFWVVSLFCYVVVTLLMTTKMDRWPNPLILYARTFVMILYFSKFIFISFLLIDDIRRGVSWVWSKVSPSTETVLPGRSDFLIKAALLVGALPFSSLLYGMIRNRYRYQVMEEDIWLQGVVLPRPLKIVHISDIHSGSFTDPDAVAMGVELINAQLPDIVCFTGDLVNNMASEMEDYIPIFSKIESKYGVFSVLGNHDYGDYVRWPSAAAKAQNLDQLKAIHAKLGWQLLLNEHKVISLEGIEVALIGVENYSTLPQFPKYGDLKKAYVGMAAADVKILLSHDPTHWDAEVVSEFKDIQLTLSGHTHGFQFGVEIPGLFKWSPSQYIYRQWAGLYDKAGQYLYVNRGYGFLGYPGRVGILPEITVLNLKNGVQ